MWKQFNWLIWLSDPGQKVEMKAKDSVAVFLLGILILIILIIFGIWYKLSSNSARDKSVNNSELRDPSDRIPLNSNPSVPESAVDRRDANSLKRDVYCLFMLRLYSTCNITPL